MAVSPGVARKRRRPAGEKSRQAMIDPNLLWTPEQREVFRQVERPTVSEWADKHVRLPQRSSAEYGRFRTDRNPVIREIQDIITDPVIDTISLCLCTQSGKTQTLCNWLGYSIDQNPGPWILGYPDREAAGRVSVQRFMPFIRETPVLKQYIPTERHRFSTYEYEFEHMVVNWAWSGSPMSMASMAARFTMGDEVDKWRLWSGRDASPSENMNKRKRTFWDAKTGLASTPTDKNGVIWRSLQLSDWRRPWVPCLHCGHFQTLRFKQVRWAGGRSINIKSLVRDNLAWYQCEKCEGKIADTKANHMRMLLAHVWAPHGCKVEADSKGKGHIVGEIPVTGHAGFQLNSCYSPFSSWSFMAGAFLDCGNDREKLMTFTNSEEADAFEEIVRKPEENMITATRLAYAEATAPAGGMMLFATVDVQLDHFWVVIRAWGAQEESWLVRFATVDSFDALENVLFRLAYLVGDQPMGVQLVLMDSRYRRDEVITWAHKQLVARPPHDVRITAGYQTLSKGLPHRMTTLDHHPKTGKRIEGGLQQLDVNTTHHKNKLARLIDSGHWHTYEGIPHQYVRHMTSEKKVMNREGEEVWQPLSEGTPNHAWDCETLQVVAAGLMHCWNWVAPGQQQVVARPGEMDAGRREDRDRSKWIQPRRRFW